MAPTTAWHAAFSSAIKLLDSLKQKVDPTNNTFTFGNTTAGFALGAGAEVRLADHWLLRGEYLYMEFDGLGGNGLISCNAPGVGNCNAGGNTTRFNFTTSKFKDNVGRVAVSYKF